MDNYNIQKYIEIERAIRYKKRRNIKKTLLGLAILAGVGIVIYIGILIPSFIRHNNKIRVRDYSYNCEDLANMMVLYEWDRDKVYKNTEEYLPELEEYKGNYIDYVKSSPALVEYIDYNLNTYPHRDRVEIDDIDDFYRNKFDKIHYEIEVTEKK